MFPSSPPRSPSPSSPPQSTLCTCALPPDVYALPPGSSMFVGKVPSPALSSTRLAMAKRCPQAARQGRRRRPRPPPRLRTLTCCGRAARCLCRKGAITRVEQHSVGDGKEMSPSSTSRVSPSPSTSAAAIQLDARRKGATAHVKQHSVDTAIVSKQHVEVAVAVHRQRYSPKNLLPLFFIVD